MLSIMDSNHRKTKLAIAAVLLMKRRVLTARAPYTRRWVRPIMTRHKEQGAYYNLLKEMEETDEASFSSYLRMPKEVFHELEAIITPFVKRQDTNMREAVCPGERLAVTLRFLATGETFASLAFQFRIGERTIAEAVPEVCEVLYRELKDKYMKTPNTPAEWEAVADGFQRHWQFPNCLGALDGKHVAILPPGNTGSMYHNYLHYFSVIMMALVDSDYKFLYVDVGRNGRCGDAGVFRDSSLKAHMQAKTLGIPPPAILPQSTNKVMPYMIVGDDAFPLGPNLMKPFAHRKLSWEEYVFNYRLSRARRIVENAFGILANRFRLFLNPIHLSPDKVDILVLAACVLHNLLRTRASNRYVTPGLIDSENPETHVVTPGDWRRDREIPRISATKNRNPLDIAKDQRKELMRYFLEEGRVDWQERMVAFARY